MALVNENNLHDLLVDALSDDFQELKEAKTSDEKDKIKNRIEGLYNLHLKEIKTEYDFETELNRGVVEKYQGEKKLEIEQRKQDHDERTRQKELILNSVKIGGEIAIGLLGLGCYCTFVEEGFKREETSTYVGQTFREMRSFFSHFLRPMKR